MNRTEPVRQLAGGARLGTAAAKAANRGPG